MNRAQFIKILLASLSAIHTTRLNSQKKIQKEVLIVGAGIAGLAAANKLVANGLQVTILEGRNRIGGRIWTDHSMGIPIEMGAEIIHGTNGNPIKKLSDQFRLQPQKLTLEHKDFFDAQGEKLTKEEYSKFYGFYKKFLERLYLAKEKATREESIELIQKIFFTDLELSELEKKKLGWIIRSELEIGYGASLKNLSLKYFDTNHFFTGGDFFLLEGLSILSSNISNGLNIKTSHIVTKIERDKKIKIHTSKGEFTSDFAIITLPLGVLKKNKVQFLPELPESKISAIQNLGMGNMNKIFLKFPKRFWDSGHNRFSMMTSSFEKMIEFWSLNRDENTHMLTAFVFGEKAVALETTNKKDQSKECMEILKKIFGNKIPNPIETNVTKWSSDPFAFGANSYLAINSELNDYETLAESVDNLLFFAGEATNSKYPATVHGAYLSGEREANKILELVGD